MKRVLSIIITMLVAFCMLFSLLFCFDSSDKMTRIKLVTGWGVLWSLVIYGIKKIKIL